MIRKLVQLLSRNTYYRRRLPARYGGKALYVSPDAQLKFLKWSDTAFDAGLLRLVDEFVTEQSIVWDIGANVGVLTFAATAKATRGRVLAIEADLWLVDLIRKSCRLKENRNLSIDVLPVAISSHVGVSSFCIAEGGRAANRLDQIDERGISLGVREKVHIATMTLDSLLESFPKPDFLKIDIEGEEVLALQGATRMLSEVRPKLYVEVGSVQSPDVARILTEHRYTIYDGGLPVAGQSALTQCPFNTVAIPQP